MRPTSFRAPRWFVFLALVLTVACAIDILNQLCLRPWPIWIAGFRLPQRRLQPEVAMVAIVLLAWYWIRFRAAMWRRPIVFGMLTVALLLGNVRYGGSGDTIPAAHLNFEIIRRHTITFDGVVALNASPDHVPYWFVEREGRLYSRYPILTPILAIPVYVIPALGQFDQAHALVRDLEKLGATLLAAAGAMLVFAALTCLVDPRSAALATVVYIAGTAVVTVLGQGMWQHTGATLCLSFGLWGLFAETSWRRGLIVGIATGATIAARPIDIVVAAPLVLALLVEDRRAVWVVACGMAGPLLAAACYNDTVLGSPLATGYGNEASLGWTTPFLTGFTGLLVSPGRGLLLFSPILALAAWAVLRLPRASQHRRTIMILMTGAAGLLIVMSRWWAWYGGMSFGPRMLSDSLPIWGIALGVAAAWSSETRRRRQLFTTLATLSVVINLMTVYLPWSEPSLRRIQLLEDGPWAPGSFPPIAAAKQFFGLGHE